MRASRDTPDALDAEGHALVAKGHAVIAEAARLRALAGSSGPSATPGDWIPAAASPLGKRRTLALARAGALESTKIGRAILIGRASLARYLDAHRRGQVAGASDEGEDLFGTRAVAS